jgi:phosphoglycerol transferase
LKELANKHQNLIIVTALLSVFVVLQMRVQSILPAIMGDEYVYSMQARKLELSELLIPNYFYSWVYSSTNMCGINYYSCAKNLNLLFFAGFIGLIFWLATRFVNRWWAGAIAFATAISPLGTYTSVFMPESMYFFFALLAVIALWWASKDQVWWHFALAGLALGLASLVKPHALFLAAGATVYLALVYWGRPRQQGVAIASYLGAALATKFGLGFVFAGPNGITLFGPTYSGTAGDFVGALFGNGSASQDLSVTVDGSAEAPTGESSAFLELTTNALTQLGWQSVVIGLLAAGLIAAAASGTKLISKSESDPDFRRLTQLLMISLATMIFVVAAFSAQVTYGGDDHTDRLLLRYFEFLIAPIAVVAVAAVSRQKDSNLRVRPLLLVVIFSALAFMGYATILDSQQMFADSVFLYGLTASDFTKLFGLFFVLTSLLAVLFAWQLRAGALAVVLVLGFGGLGSFSTDRLYSQAAFPGPIDSAGIFARDYLTNVPSEQIFFLGTNKQLTEASIFWLDKPNIGREYFLRGSVVNEGLIPKEVRWVVALEGVGFVGERLFEVKGDRFAIARVGPVNEHRFDQQMINSPLMSFSGLSNPTALGSWNLGEDIRLEFKSPLSPNARVVLSVLASSAAVGQPLTFRLGDAELEVVLDQAGTSVDLRLAFANQQPESVLEIRTSAGTAVLLSRIEITD